MTRDGGPEHSYPCAIKVINTIKVSRMYNNKNAYTDASVHVSSILTNNSGEIPMYFIRC